MNKMLAALTTLLVLASAMALLVCIPQPTDAVTKTVTTFSNGGTEYETTFTGDSYDRSISIVAPNNCTVDAATLRVSGSGHGGVYPMNVTIDVGDDDKPEWRFMGNGYGALGHQKYFKGTYSSNKQYFFDSSALSHTDYVMMPKNATVTSADLKLRQFTVPNHGLKLAPAASDGAQEFTYPYTYSSDYSTSSYRPRLSVTWSGGSYTSPQTSTLQDAMTTSRYKSSNYGTYSYLMYYYAANGWMKFDLSTIPADTQITSANLQIRTGYAGGSKDIGVFASLSSWSENSITYNNMPDVHPTHFGHKTTTGYQQVTIDIQSLVQQWVGTTPSNVGIDVGGGGADWTHSGSFTGTTTTADLATYFNSAIQTLPVADTNNYGVQFVEVPITISSATAGAIELSNLDIKYDFIADVDMNPYNSGLVATLNNKIPSKPSTGDANVPINISSDTAGKVKLQNLFVQYEEPNYEPTIGGIPDASLDEDTKVEHLIDLSTYSADALDDPTAMTYMVQSNTQKKYVDVSIVDGHYLKVDSTKTANWNGETKVHVSVTDSGGKYAFSNYFNITINPVNDEPTIDDTMNDVIIDEGTGQEVLILPKDVSESTYFTDIDSETFYYWVDVDPNGVYTGEKLVGSLIEDGNNWIVKLKASGDWNTEDGTPVPVRITCDDDDEKGDDGITQDFEVRIYPVNDEPVWDPIQDLEIDEDSDETLWVDLSEYVDDIDDELSDIKFKVVDQDPSSKYITISVKGTKAYVTPAPNYYGDVEVTFQADDGDNKTNTKGFVTVNGVNDLPTVAITSHTDGAEITEKTTIMGEANDPEDLKAVELRIDNGNWETLDSTFFWTYELNPSDMSSGEHTVSVRSYDGIEYSDTASIKVNVQGSGGTAGNNRPIVTMISPKNLDGATMSGSEYKLKGRVSDADNDKIEWVKVQIDGGSWETAEGTSSWEYVFDTTLYANDDLTINVKAYDGTDESLVVNIVGKVSNEDGDYDGLPDGWEMDNFGDTTSYNGGDDPDEDGYSNEDELAAGTDPNNAADYPAVETGDTSTNLASEYGIYIAIAVLAVVVLAIFIVGAIVLLRGKKDDDDDEEDDLPFVEAEPEAIPEAIDEAPTQQQPQQQAYVATPSAQQPQAYPQQQGAYPVQPVQQQQAVGGYPQQQAALPPSGQQQYAQQGYQQPAQQAYGQQQYQQ